MTITIHTGDCRDVLATLPAASVDCVVTDPPYGETSLKWDRRVKSWPAMVLPLIKPTGSMWVFGSLSYFMETAADFNRAGWKVSHEVVWEKHNGSSFFNDRFRRVHELAVHFYPAGSAWANIWKEPQFTSDGTARIVRRKAKPAQWTGARGSTVYVSDDGGPRLMRSVIYARSEHGRAVHPTQKPIEIVEPLVRYACPPCGTVLDPFAGSGTTGVVANRLGRNAVLIELNPDYAEMARQRLANDAPLLAEVV